MNGPGAGRMSLPTRMRTRRQKAKASFFHGLLCWLPPEGVAQISNDPDLVGSS